MNIDFFGQPGITVYAIVASPLYIYNPSTMSSDALGGAISNATYAVALSESGSLSGSYSATINFEPGDTVKVEYWQQVGGSPDRAADLRIGMDEDEPVVSSGGGGSGTVDLSGIETELNRIGKRVDEIWKLRAKRF